MKMQNNWLENTYKMHTYQHVLKEVHISNYHSINERYNTIIFFKWKKYVPKKNGYVWKSCYYIN